MIEPYTVPFKRRDYHRFRLEAQAELFINQSLQTVSLLKDISSRGAGVINSSQVTTGDNIKVVIHAPFFFRGSLHKQARVAWSKHIGGGFWQAGLDFGQDNLIELANRQ